MSTAALIIGAASAVVGTGVSIAGSIQETNARKKAENARQRQASLEATRQRREIIRNQVVARAQALSTAASQGGQFGSGLQGGYGQIAGQAGNQTLAVNQSEALGNQVFAANRDLYSASVISDFGSGLQSLGGLAINSAGTFRAIGHA